VKQGKEESKIGKEKIPARKREIGSE